MSSRVERGRTLARSQALQILFQAEALDLSVDEVLAGDYLISKGPLDPYAIELARGCHDNIQRIDYVLMSLSKNWSLYRMPSTDRNLLRIAVYELRFLEGEAKLDDAVVINEAVEIAKAYGTDESSRFVNGVLGKVSRLAELPVEEVQEEVEDSDLDSDSDLARDDESLMGGALDEVEEGESPEDGE